VPRGLQPIACIQPLKTPLLSGSFIVREANSKASLVPPVSFEAAQRD
jgi:hypothetical protein